MAWRVEANAVHRITGTFSSWAQNKTTKGNPSNFVTRLARIKLTHRKIGHCRPTEAENFNDVQARPVTQVTHSRCVSNEGRQYLKRLGTSFGAHQSLLGQAGITLRPSTLTFGHVRIIKILMLRLKLVRTSAIRMMEHVLCSELV